MKHDRGHKLQRKFQKISTLLRFAYAVANKTFLHGNFLDQNLSCNVLFVGEQ